MAIISSRSVKPVSDLLNRFMSGTRIGRPCHAHSHASKIGSGNIRNRIRPHTTVIQKIASADTRNTGRKCGRRVVMHPNRKRRGACGIGTHGVFERLKGFSGVIEGLKIKTAAAGTSHLGAIQQSHRRGHCQTTNCQDEHANNNLNQRHPSSIWHGRMIYPQNRLINIFYRKFTTYDIRHTTYNIRHTTFDIRPTDIRLSHFLKRLGFSPSPIFRLVLHYRSLC